MSLFWFLPGFLRSINREGEHPARALKLNNLPTMLAKTSPIACPDLWTACAQQFHLKVFPFAQVIAANSNLPVEQDWALLTPMAIQPEHRGIYLLGERVLNLSETERKQLREELNAWMQEDGLQLHATPSEHWLLGLNKRNDVHTTPYLQVIGRDAMTVMPSGADAMYWQAKMTEWQMILQRSFINQQRQQNQQKLVQGLHLWGESSTQLPHSTRVSAVYTDSDAIARWLTQTATGIKVCSLKDVVNNEFDQALVIAANGESAWANGDLDSWQYYWQTLDKLIDPKTSHIIYPDNGFSYSVTSSQRFKFWRGENYFPQELK